MSERLFRNSYVDSRPMPLGSLALAILIDEAFDRAGVFEGPRR